MLDFKQIQELIKLVNKTNMSEVRLEQDNFKLLIRGENFSNSKNPTNTFISPSVPAIANPISTQNPVADSPKTVEPASPAADASPEAAKADVNNENLVQIKSPMIGTFYRSSAPEKPPYIKVGDSIEKGSVICMVEAMKLFNEIEAEISGTIVKVLVENASPVEYDTPLFLVDPS